MKHDKDEERINRMKEMLEAMTSETPSAPNQNSKARGLEKDFGLGNSGDANQFVQDENYEDDQDPMGSEEGDEDDTNAQKAVSGKKVLTNPAKPRLFRSNPSIIMKIIHGSR